MSNTFHITQPNFASDHSQTRPDPYIHPVKAFLMECGIDVSEFPIVHFRFEVPERKQLRPHRVFMPIYIPHSHGILYESFFRIVRLVEVPDLISGKHRIFFDLEWSIREEAIPEEENHLAHHFLAPEFICPNCKDSFAPDLDQINAQCLQIVCPQCLYEWMIRIDPTTEGLPATESLMELFQSDPSQLREYLNDWTPELKTYENAAFSTYFPVQFNAQSNFDNDPVVKKFFSDDLRPLYQAENDFQQLDFASIVRSLANHVAITYFRREENTSKLTTTVNSSPFDQTDIQSKTDIQRIVEKSEVNILLAAEKALYQSNLENLRRKNRIVSAKENSDLRNIQVPMSHRFKSLIYGLGIFAVTVGVMLLAIFFLVLPSTPHEPAPAPTLATAKVEAIAITNPAPAASEQIEEPLAPVVSKPNLIKALPKKIEVVAAAPSVTSTPKLSFAKPAAEDSKKQKVAEIDANYREGMLHLKLQQSNEAVTSFKKVLELDAKNLEAMRGLGLAYVYGQKFDPAIEIFEKYLKLANNSFDRSSVEELIKTLKDRSTASAK